MRAGCRRQVVADSGVCSRADGDLLAAARHSRLADRRPAALVAGRKLAAARLVGCDSVRGRRLVLRRLSRQPGPPLAGLRRSAENPRDVVDAPGRCPGAGEQGRGRVAGAGVLHRRAGVVAHRSGSGRTLGVGHGCLVRRGPGDGRLGQRAAFSWATRSTRVT
ncbi:MAG: hypothetical protein MZV63_19540 [Marinilabiliales bacterium]|nr:hypothetical protein [Marinilabiliales bacterium]